VLVIQRTSGCLWKVRLGNVSPQTNMGTYGERVNQVTSCQTRFDQNNVCGTGSLCGGISIRCPAPRLYYMASIRIYNEAEWMAMNGRILYMNGGLDSGSMVRSLVVGLSTTVIGSRSVVSIGLSLADGSSNGSQE
jgi:hypothetical protein